MSKGMDGVQEPGGAEGGEGPGWGPAVKPLLIPELGSEIRTAALWADGLACSAGVAGLGKAWAGGSAGLASRS